MGSQQSWCINQWPRFLTRPLPGLSYRWLLNEFPNFIPTDGRHFVSQTTGNLYIARTNASDLGNYSCLATSHMDFSTKSVFSKFAQLNLAAEGQGWCTGPGEGAEGLKGVGNAGFPFEAVKSSLEGTGSGPGPRGPPVAQPQSLAPAAKGKGRL